MIRDYVIDMEFVPLDENGLIIQDVSGNIPRLMLSTRRWKIDLCFQK